MQIVTTTTLPVDLTYEVDSAEERRINLIDMISNLGNIGRHLGFSFPFFFFFFLLFWLFKN
jgi:hypothetical protein